MSTLFDSRVTIVPRDYQQEAIDNTFAAFDRGERSVLIRQPTGCHAVGQGILMFDGSIKRVEQINVGDLLMGPDSTPRTVLRLIRGTGEMVRVVPVKGSSFVVNVDHVLTLVKTTQGPGKRCKGPSRYGGNVIDVTVKEWLGWSKTKRHLYKLFRVGVEFANDTPLLIDPYFLGVLLGDGSLNRSICVTTADDEIISEVHTQATNLGLRTRVQRAGGKSNSYYLTNGTQRVRSNAGCFVNSHPLIDKLRKIGVYGVACENKFVPKEYLTSHRYERLSLLAGLLDTDGHCSNGGYDFISKSKQLSLDVCFVARSVGLAAYITKTTKTCSTTRVSSDYYRVYISGDCSIIPCKVKRKHAIVRRQKKDVCRTGFTIERLNVADDYYGFTINRDGRYLLDDFTVTHNSGKTVTGSLIADRWLSLGSDHKVVVLAHERQLIQQFAAEIHDILGISPAIEMGNQHCRGSEDIIVGSRQTLYVKGDYSRLYKFSPNYKWLVICDEAHRWKRSLSSCRHIVSWFDAIEGSCRIGLTATPERSDKVAVTDLFETVAIDYRLFDPDGGRCAVGDGWAVPYDQRYITVEGVDFQEFKVDGKDFNESDLEHKLGTAEQLRRIVDPLMSISGSRQTIVYSPTTKMAHDVAMFINGLRGADVAVSVDGTMPDFERQAIYAKHKSCAVQYLSCCGLCVAKGTLVLTDRGEIPIEDITTDMQLWDGVEFVSHDGVIAKGTKNVIEYAGLTATPDHKVWTPEGWKTLSTCKMSGLSICVAGFNGHPLLESKCYVRAGAWNSKWTEQSGVEVYDIINSGPRNRFTANGLIISNCKEGYNDCNIACVAIFRPTKSRALAEQMKGRGCRPLRGCVSSDMTKEERLHAISSSEKPNCLIVDLVGATGLGDVPSTVELMAEGKPDEVIQLAKQRVLEKGKRGAVDVAEEIRLADEEIKAERERKEAERKARAAELRRLASLKAETRFTEHKVTSEYRFGSLGRSIGKGRHYELEWGKYKGKTLGQCPFWYLKWLAKNCRDGLVKKNLDMYREEYREQMRKQRSQTGR